MAPMAKMTDPMNRAFFPKIVCAKCSSPDIDMLCYVFERQSRMELMAYDYRARCPQCLLEGIVTVTKEFIMSVPKLEDVKLMLTGEDNPYVNPLWGEIKTAVFSTTFYATSTNVTSLPTYNATMSLIESYPPEPPMSGNQLKRLLDYVYNERSFNKSNNKSKVKVAPPVGKRKIRLNGDE